MSRSTHLLPKYVHNAWLALALAGPGCADDTTGGGQDSTGTDGTVGSTPSETQPTTFGGTTHSGGSSTGASSGDSSGGSSSGGSSGGTSSGGSSSGSSSDGSSSGSSSDTDGGSSSTGNDTCGDDAIDGSDLCDGTDVGGETCVSEGFYGGTLACAVDCSAYDASACISTILSPSDPIIPFDLDGDSFSHAGEGPEFVVDDVAATKYLNFGGAGSGFIVTLVQGASIADSFQLTTANDSTGRDPASWEIYGTNDAIQSTDHSDATGGEVWVLLDSGVVDLPLARLTAGGVVDFTNAAAYTSYRVVFPTVRSAGNYFQLGDMQLFDPAAVPLLSAEESGNTLATHEVNGSSSSPPPETVVNTIDGTASLKYLNTGQANSGFVVTPTGPGAGMPVRALRVTTANDASGRDPQDWALYGTDDPITSVAHGTGSDENWMLIASGTFTAAEVPLGRLTQGAMVSVVNEAVYTSYRLVMESTRDAGAPSMQVGEVEFFDGE